MLDFQLKEHERFLKKFLEVFRQIDSDGDGVLSEVGLKTYSVGGVQRVSKCDVASRRSGLFLAGD